MKKSATAAGGFQDYLQGSSVHGLVYLSPYHGLFVRLIWLTLLLFGFTTSGYMIYQSYHQWQEDPVETVIDSLAESVLNIQFPTVTVCPDSKTPLDNWAPVEAIANQLQWQCNAPDPWANNTCLTSHQIRNDLDFFMDIMVEKWTDALGIKYADVRSISNATFDKYVNDSNDVPSMDMLFLNSEDIYDYVMAEIQYLFGRYTSLYRYLMAKYKSEGFNFTSMCNRYSNKYSNSNFAKCVELIHNRDLLDLKMHEMMGDGVGLGAFLSTYAPYVELSVSWKTLAVLTIDEQALAIARSLNINKQPKNLYGRSWMGLHAFFTNLTEGFDLGGVKYLTSLFELPNMISPFYYRGSDPPLHSQIRYTQATTPAALLQSCVDEWIQYVSNYANVTHTPNCSFSVEDYIGRNLTSVFKLMKLIRHAGMTFVTESPSDKQFLPKYEKQAIGNDSNKVDLLSAIPYCEYARKWSHNERQWKLDCSLFSPVATDKGICYSFNGLNTTELLRDSYFSKSFQNAHRGDFSQVDNVNNSVGVGEQTGLIFYLDRQAFLRGDRDKDKLPQHSFTISLNNFRNPFQIRSKRVGVRIGQWTTLYVTPSQLAADPDIRNLPIRARNCKFSDEADDSKLFKTYTQASCQFECLLEHSRKACNCTPWNYPFLGSANDMKMCEMLGAACFEEFMGRHEHAQECNCNPDCEDIEFKVTGKEEKPLDPDEFCGSQGLFRKQYLDPKIVSRKDRFDFIQNTLKLTRNKYGTIMYEYGTSMYDPKIYNQIAMDRMCRELVLQDLAVVAIQMDTDVYVRNRRSLKMTFEAQLGSIGGTLGLFTGMSLLSLAEILHWMIKALVRRISIRTSLD